MLLALLVFDFAEYEDGCLKWAWAYVDGCL